jgi:hypothetical protein
MVPNFAHFSSKVKLGMNNKKLENQTKAQQQGEFTCDFYILKILNKLSLDRNIKLEED